MTAAQQVRPAAPRRRHHLNRVAGERPPGVGCCCCTWPPMKNLQAGLCRAPDSSVRSPPCAGRPMVRMHSICTAAGVVPLWRGYRGQGASRCVAVQVPERACGAAGPRQSTGGFTSVKRLCALIRDRCQSSGAGAPRPPPPLHCAEPVSWAPHLLTVHADRPSRVLCRTALSARKGDTETPRMSYTTRPPTQKRKVMYTLCIRTMCTPHCAYAQTPDPAPSPSPPYRVISPTRKRAPP